MATPLCSGLVSRWACVGSCVHSPLMSRLVLGGAEFKPAVVAETIAPRDREVFPVFVPLPLVERLREEGGLTEYVERAVGLDAAGREELSARYDVVLLLDSLDEVRGAVSCCLPAINPWGKGSYSVILTTRGESRGRARCSGGKRQSEAGLGGMSWLRAPE